MMTTHSHALQIFARKLAWLLMLRRAVRWMSAWFFVCGVLILAARIAGTPSLKWLALGILMCVPLAIFAALWERRRLPAFNKIRASYDHLEKCGGLLMAEETAEMSAWHAQLPAASVPGLRWAGSRSLLVLFVAALFVAVTMLLPERLTHLGHRSLEVGKIVDQLQAEVQTLAQEKIIDDKKSDDLQKQLAQLQKDASGYNPDKTWEALDHIKQSDSDLAKQAAEEAVQKTESLTEAETLAQAMQQAADEGMTAATASQAAQDLESLLNAAKLEEGVLNGKIPPELLANLNGLNKEQMEKLVKAMESNKNSLGQTLGDLAKLKMIDPAMLAKLGDAGKKGNSDELAAYLAQCQGGNCDSEILFSWLRHKGGGRGGPGAEMTWDNDTSEKDLKFQEHALPPATQLDAAQLVGVSKAAPELSANDIATGHGALDNAAASGGSAHAQAILPEQKQAVQNFFKRDNQ
jgi:hypothetical protein